MHRDSPEVQNTRFYYHVLAIVCNPCFILNLDQWCSVANTISARKIPPQAAEVQHADDTEQPTAVLDLDAPTSTDVPAAPTPDVESRAEAASGDAVQEEEARLIPTPL